MFISGSQVENCIIEIGFGIGRRNAQNLTKAINLCRQHLEEERNTYCLKGVNLGLRRKYSGEKFKQKCKRLKEISEEINC